ncbi:hypothetical protein [Pontibacter cellulosilyticus]|uniref:Uncharacterized protein n=1 Tax=Pontibacter cellulosilyticus TaxID=1720253 RepID=A0A923N8S6_9BACT|nr:hypothetical protein [Pontibacter cellulosilyticus]MBC5994311.1 hypothetical protein [Pontibacter cellulosilyticus]
MNTIKHLATYISSLCLICLLYSCEGRRDIEDTEVVTVDTAEEDTAMVVKSGKTAEEQLEEFRGWLNKQSEKGDTAIRRNWPKVREELRQRNAQLEQNFDSLSEKSQEEYKDLRSRYERWEARQERRQQQPLETAKLERFQDQLLREYKDIKSISAGNIREAYLTFMGTVRAQRRNWSQDDWDYVDHVYARLNERRGQVEGQISTGDNIKIRALQAEYLALEGSADTQSAVRSTDN